MSATRVRPIFNFALALLLATRSGVAEPDEHVGEVRSAFVPLFTYTEGNCTTGPPHEEVYVTAIGTWQSAGPGVTQTPPCDYRYVVDFITSPAVKRTWQGKPHLLLSVPNSRYTCEGENPYTCVVNPPEDYLHRRGTIEIYKPNGNSWTFVDSEQFQYKWAFHPYGRCVAAGLGDGLSKVYGETKVRLAIYTEYERKRAYSSPPCQFPERSTLDARATVGVSYYFSPP